MDSRSRELLQKAAERLGRHGQNMPDLLLSDSIYRYLRNEVVQPAEARIEQED